MGFRNPARTATAVDTRPGATAAGVKVAGASTTWFDGYGSSATAVLTTPPGGGTGGDSFTLTGPKRLAGYAPSVALTEEGAPAGGYFTAARITADKLSIPSALDLPAITLAPTANYKAAAGTGGTPGADQLGDYVFLRGALTNAITPYNANAGASYQVGSVPAAVAPTVSPRYFTVACATGSAWSSATLIIATSGAVSMIPAAALVAGFTLFLGGPNWRVGST